ncbi:MAG TPA: Gfo/Idh/MocA family oxidoreductase [Candidatus Methylacidiphilales bacterium]
MKSKSISSPLRVGVIGCGAISNAYFKGLSPFSDLAQITACADLDLDRAKAKAAEHGVAKAYSVRELLADPEVDAVLNLTIPAAHAEVNLAALKAGKHAYCEKPFALTYKEGLKVLQEAQKRKLRVGCAPDTVLGGGIQTCRKLINDGAIGLPVAATANMLCHGHESWHPSPEFYYQVGGGPLFDMGPYYLTSLVTMLGPVKSVSASAKATFKERLITSQPLNGKRVKVEVPTHLSGVLEFSKGVLATVTMSFDVWAHHLPLLEIYGTEGSLQCPDPNTFGGEVLLWTTKKKEWEKIPLTHSDQTGRGLGIADLADALKKRRQHRMNGELGLHILEMMEAFPVSARSGRKIEIKSGCRQPEPLTPGLPLGRI